MRVITSAIDPVQLDTSKDLIVAPGSGAARCLGGSAAGCSARIGVLVLICCGAQVAAHLCLSCLSRQTARFML